MDLAAGNVQEEEDGNDQDQTAANGIKVLRGGEEADREAAGTRYYKEMGVFCYSVFPLCLGRVVACVITTLLLL